MKSLCQFFLWLSFGCIAVGQDAASVPRLINYQGRLVDETDAALPDGEYTLRFKLYDAAVEGLLVWGEEREISARDGIFNVALGGAEAALDAAPVKDLRFAFGDPDRYLETTVVSGPGIGNEQILAPRQQMASVPFSVEAQNAERAAVATLAESLIPELANALNPPGTIIAYGASVNDTGDLIEPVPGYLLCNGAVIDEGAEDGKFSNLILKLDDRWGAEPDEGTISTRLPDLSGLALRSVGSQTVAGRVKQGPTVVGRVQEDRSNHIKDVRTNGWQSAMNHQNTTIGIPSSGIYSSYFFTGEGGDGGARQRMRIRVHGRETRVASAGVHYLIKY